MDDVLQLQAQFMQLQKQKPTQKISERVVVEILLKIIERKKIRIFFTSDRKEYLTPRQLHREISDEIYASGGRITFQELFSVLNLDESTIERNARELVQEDRTLSIISSNTIISESYCDKVAEEINESLQEAGQLKVTELASRFALPLDILLNIIKFRLISENATSRFKKVIKGRLESPLLFTENFVSRHTAILRGILSSITVPTLLHQITQKFDFDESLFNCLDFFLCFFSFF